MTTTPVMTSQPPGGGSCPPMGDGPADIFVYVCEAVIIPIIFAVGVISNCFSLMILPRASIAPSFKTCLLALTLSDLCAGVVGFVQMMVEVIAFDGNICWGYWDDRAVTSHSLYYIFSLFICTSSAIVIAIVAIRHYTISRPVSAKMNITSRCAKVICLCLFFATLIVFLPTILNVLWQSCYRERTSEICLKVREVFPNLTKITSLYLLFVTILYGPVLVLVYIGCMIGIKVNLEKTEKILESLQEDNSCNISERKSRRRNTMRITKTLLLIILLDTICCLPLVVQAFALVIAPKETVFSSDNQAYRIFDSIAEIFLVCRQAYNFWLYAFSHKNFRLRAKSLLFCLCVPKYRDMWKSPSSQAEYRGRPTRHNSATSGRLRSLDLDTDATWVKSCELKDEGRDESLTEGKKGDVEMENVRESVEQDTLLNGKEKGKEKEIKNTTKL